MALSCLTGGISHSWHTLSSLANLSHAVCVLKLVVCFAPVPARRLPASSALIPPGLESLDNSVTLHLVNLFHMSHYVLSNVLTHSAHTLPHYYIIK